MMHGEALVVKRPTLPYAAAMLRQVLAIAAAAAVAALAAGCGGGTHQPATTAKPLAGTVACQELELDVQFISQLISNNVEAITHSIHPKQLAHRTGVAHQSLLVAARLVERFRAPAALVHARAQLIDGLQRYAADFGRAQHSVAKNDLATASEQLVDPQALEEVKAATKEIDRHCRA
jgi:hypothetical protein